MYACIDSRGSHLTAPLQIDAVRHVQPPFSVSEVEVTFRYLE